MGINEQEDTIDDLKNELKESKDNYYSLKKDNEKTIEKLNIKLNNYSNDIDIDKEYLIEEKNKSEIDVLNKINEQQDTIDDLKNELKESKDIYHNLKKDSEKTIEKLNIKLN